MMNNNTCTRCNENLPLDCFRSKNGYTENVCKVCRAELSRDYKRTKDGWVSCVYSHQKQTSKKREHKSPSYTKQELLSWCSTQPEFGIVFDAWEESGYSKDMYPSIDRKDDMKPYSFENIQLTTWKTNRDKQYEEVGKLTNSKFIIAVTKCYKNGDVICSYASISDASRDTGIPDSNISNCISGKRKSAGGFKWLSK